jgi:hypothetical protein
MAQWMDLLRGPVLGVIMMIMLLAGVLIISAFAALMAQMGLLFKTTSKHTMASTARGNDAEGEARNCWHTPDGQNPANWHTQNATNAESQRSPSGHPRREQMVVYEHNGVNSLDVGW